MRTNPGRKRLYWRGSAMRGGIDLAFMSTLGHGAQYTLSGCKGHRPVRRESLTYSTHSTQIPRREPAKSMYGGRFDDG